LTASDAVARSASSSPASPSASASNRRSHFQAVWRLTRPVRRVGDRHLDLDAILTPQ
jgi:hypothetical protein